MPRSGLWPLDCAAVDAQARRWSRLIGRLRLGVADMTAPRTVFFWGFYVTAVGLVLLIIPNVLFTVFGLPASSEPWPRVLGALATALGFYYIQSGRSGDMTFTRSTVVGRVWFCLCTVALVALGLSRWPLVLFGILDLAGAAWSANELRQPRVLPVTKGGVTA